MNAKEKFTFDAIPTNRRSFTAEEFVHLSKKERDDIKSVRFIPPKIGSEGFGSFDVELGTAWFEVCLD
ncbi:hypothetical protein MUB13_26585 [Pseudomonas aeruginosa]|uniref:hypothetical protein n=1 Tax=Pseudomonas aeruginosa TaxID=287 RepID=UPI001FB7FF2D|nr:hypothetical protein [Pseudomonas aeruginosa]MCJ1952427.1 hypothetical protein [Pseudomonas aeruginosa]